MASSGRDIDDIRREIDEQGAAVRSLKAAVKAGTEQDPDGARLKAEVAKLKQLKADLKAEVDAASAPSAEETEAAARREAFDRLLLAKMFVVPSFEIYGGVAGLYDFGPPGSALMNNLQALWRSHFVLEEEMLEVAATAMTPESVLRVSGHVEKFEDLMVRDEKTGECLRADHLLEGHIDRLLDSEAGRLLPEARRTELRSIRGQADAYSPEELGAQLAALGVTSSEGNPITAPFPFNLMFKTDIGPTGKFVGYLRPETAQGIFVNFRRLLEYNGGKLPFAAAQIGSAFRNEIAPRAGLLRVREFALAEIEHFVNPAQKEHPKFGAVADLRLNLLPKALQDGVERPFATPTLGEAVRDGTIDNETLAYFMGRTQLFLLEAGVDPARLRFRQHLDNEMAHYAQDCWDAEVRTTHGWVECVGHSDRSCFDLERHSKASKVDMQAQVVYAEPRFVERAKITFDKRAMGKAFKRDNKAVTEALEGMGKEELVDLDRRLREEGAQEVAACDRTFTVEPGMLSVAVVEEKVSVEKFYPSVVEPSFGLGRILYCVLEHAFDNKAYPKDPSRCVLRLSPAVAPFKVGLLPIGPKPELMAIVERVRRECVALNVSTRVDSSKGTSIGKKYARCEELGVPFCITVDFESPKNGMVTIRDRDSGGRQVLVPADEIATLTARLCSGATTWASVWEKYEQVPPRDE